MLQGLTDKLSSYLDPKEVDRVKRAYHFSEKCHLGQMRQSGDPYITHPLAVANILADLHMAVSYTHLTLPTIYSV